LGGLIIEDFIKLAGNYFFPMVLSCYLIYRIDNLLSKMVEQENLFHETVINEIKEIKTDIYNIRIDMANRKC